MQSFAYLDLSGQGPVITARSACTVSCTVAVRHKAALQAAFDVPQLWFRGAPSVSGIPAQQSSIWCIMLLVHISLQWFCALL